MNSPPFNGTIYRIYLHTVLARCKGGNVNTIRDQCANSNSVMHVAMVQMQCAIECRVESDCIAWNPGGILRG
jgi:hypothetical protein